MKTNSWFTLVELIVSISILWLILTWISIAFINTSKYISKWNKVDLLWNDIFEFITNSYSFYYSTWHIIKHSEYFDSIILEKKYWSGWVLIWVFNNWDYDYTLAQNQIIWDYNFWYFNLNESILEEIKNDNNYIYNINYNNWKIFNNMDIYNLNASQMENSILIELELFKVPNERYFLVSYNDLKIDMNNIFKIDFKY